MSFTIFKHCDPLPPHLHGAVAALGNFDGYHLGHQAVGSAAIAEARKTNVPAIIATFDPHPVRHFAPHVPPFRLTTLEQRAQIYAQAGADAMLVFAFDADLASMPAQSFVQDLLRKHLSLSMVVTGEDFSFGKARGGNIDRLRAWGAECGLAHIAVGPVTDDHGVISSTRVRDHLKAGEISQANALLTRPFTVRGMVQHGDKNGRKLGYPTANIDMGHYLRPRYGIYAVRGRLPDGRVVDGAANMGIRPSFDPPKELLEPHFFDFAGDLYGQMIEVEFHAFIRPEAKFDDLEALKLQMARDCEQARDILKNIPS